MEGGTFDITHSSEKKKKRKEKNLLFLKPDVFSILPQHLAAMFDPSLSLSLMSAEKKEVGGAKGAFGLSPAHRST